MSIIITLGVAILVGGGLGLLAWLLIKFVRSRNRYL